MTRNQNNYQILAPSVQFLAFNLLESEIIKLKSNRRRISKDWLWKTCDNIVSKVLQQEFVITNYLDLTKELSSRRLEVQEENNLSLQQRITALGFGLSVGSILSQIIANDKFAPEFIKPMYKTVEYYPFYYISATAFCLAVGILFAISADRLFILVPWILSFSIKRWISKVLGNKNKTS